MLLAALGSLLAALRGSGLGTSGFTMVWGPGSCETIGFTRVWELRGCETNGFTMVWSLPGREDTRGSGGAGGGFGGAGGGIQGGEC